MGVRGTHSSSNMSLRWTALIPASASESAVPAFPITTAVAAKAERPRKASAGLGSRPEDETARRDEARPRPSEAEEKSTRERAADAAMGGEKMVATAGFGG